MPTPRVVIVGGGFGGLYAARRLVNKPVRVTVVDRRNHHVFQPLLYQVATAALSPGDIAQPIRSILRRGRNVEVVLGEVTGVDLEQRRVLLGDGELPYDYLILAPGSRHSYFGHDEWETLAPGLKSIDDALEVRRRILAAFEEAERLALAGELSETEANELLTFVVVGAGPTGVEMAGAIAEIARHTLRGEFRAIDPTRARVVMLEGAPRVLPTFPEDLARSAAKQLARVGVEVRTSTLVTHVTPEAVFVGEERIPTRTVVWAAGVAVSPLARSLGVPLDRSGRVPVELDLTVPGHPEVYVVGDLALFAHGLERPLPGLAAVACQEGEAAAENVLRTVRGEPRKAFKYFNKGLPAIIGRGAGVAAFGPVHLSGQIAWLAWLFIHLLLLIGFRNRFVVLTQWAWSYAMKGARGARLITGGAAAAPAARERARVA